MHSIECSHINRFYGTQQVLGDVSFVVDKGQVTGLLGPNGAGKTTLMKILTSYLPPNEGNAFVHDFNVQTEALKIRKLVGYLPENNPLYPEMYVREYLGFVLKMYDTEFSLKKRVDEVIELTGLTTEQYKKIGALSKGYRQRVGLAQSLIHDPPVLILDEPTTGLDPNQLTGIRQVITRLGKEKAVLLSTHIMQEVEAVCNRVVILNKGRVVADGKVDVVLQKTASTHSYFLELKEQVSDTLLKEIPEISFVEKHSDTQWILHFEPAVDAREIIFGFMVKKGLTLLSFSVKQENLEDVFHQLTKA